jgi:hypothetical protein
MTPSGKRDHDQKFIEALSGDLQICRSELNTVSTLAPSGLKWAISKSSNIFESDLQNYTTHEEIQNRSKFY